MFAKKGQAVIYGILIMLVAVILLAAIAPMIQAQITTTASSLTGLSAEGVKLIFPFIIIFFIFLPLLIVFTGS